MLRMGLECILITYGFQYSLFSNLKEVKWKIQIPIEGMDPFSYSVIASPAESGKRCVPARRSAYLR